VRGDIVGGMSGSFSVDVAALGEIPRQLSAVRASLASIRAGQLAPTAGARRFASALDAFAAAGASAVDRDVAALTTAAAAYRRNEDGIVRATTTVGR
jgi:hypothetical protein